MEHGIVAAGLGLAIMAVAPFIAEPLIETLGYISCHLDGFQTGKVCVLP